MDAPQHGDCFVKLLTGEDELATRLAQAKLQHPGSVQPFGIAAAGYHLGTGLIELAAKNLNRALATIEVILLGYCILPVVGDAGPELIAGRHSFEIFQR